MKVFKIFYSANNFGAQQNILHDFEKFQFFHLKSLLSQIHPSMFTKKSFPAHPPHGCLASGRRSGIMSRPLWFLKKYIISYLFDYHLCIFGNIISRVLGGGNRSDQVRWRRKFWTRLQLSMLTLRHTIPPKIYSCSNSTTKNENSIRGNL